MAVGFIEKRPEPPLAERVLWTVRKDRRTAEARIRLIPGVARRNGAPHSTN